MPGETSDKTAFLNGNGIKQNSIPNDKSIRDVAQDAPRSKKTIFTKLGKLAPLKMGLIAGVSLISISALANGGLFSLGFWERQSTIFTTPDVLMVAAFGGAMSFALLSASWMIRERKRIIEENNALKSGLVSLRAVADRNEALVAIAGQCTLIWNKPDEDPSVLGKFLNVSRGPNNPAEFLDFSSWLSETSAIALKPLVKALRREATSFDEIIETRNGEVLEAKGRTSGACAYIRFAELSGEHEEFAQLKTQHQKILSKFNLIEALFSKIPMPVWMQEKDGRLSWVNSAYAKALDLDSVTQVLDRQAELFDKEQRNTIRESSGDQKLFNAVLPATVAGDRKKLEVYNIQTASGIMGLALDQSATDDVRTTLNETIEGHARMLDQLATAVAIFDKSQKLVFHNSGFQNLWGLEPSILENSPSNADILDAIRDQNILPLNPDWKKWRNNHLEIYTAIEPVEEWWHLLDGQTLRVMVTPRNEGGATWVFENVTERLALESNLKSVMRIQGETLDHLIEAVAVFGSDGKLKLFNPALSDIWSKSGLEAAEGMHIAKVIEDWTQVISNEEDLTQILGKITGFDDTRENFSGRLSLSNGEALQYSVVPLPEGQSMLTLTNITANVNFERALQERAEALEESDRLKNKFIQHVSYELRAPLTSISGFGELLSTPEMGELNNKQEEYVDHINEAADALRGIVDDILDLASIDAGNMTLDHETVDLNMIVQQVLASFETVREEKRIEFKTSIKTGNTSLIADKKRIAQILENLISNALSFSPDGGSVSISATRKQGFHEISVIDEGPGVDETQRNSVFERFETSTQDGNRLGTGLGLSIVRSFVNLHGGEVRVETMAKGGACFVFTIPENPSVEMGDLEKIA